MICVDALREVLPNAKWKHNKASHMISDVPGSRGTEELVAFAISLGLKGTWIQHAGKHTEHFDLNASKHELAIARGATLVDRREFSQKMRAKLQEGIKDE